MKAKRSHCLVNSANEIVQFQNGSNKVAIKLRVVQFWSEIILVMLNQTRAARSFVLKTTRMISDQIAIRSVQLQQQQQQPLFTPFSTMSVTFF